MTLLIDHISFERQYKSILDQIHIELHPGELLQITGSNGSGKSTLLRILAGLIKPDSGQVLWQNQCIFNECDDYQIHYIGHLNGIRPQLTVYENIQLFRALTSTPHPPCGHPGFKHTGAEPPNLPQGEKGLLVGTHCENSLPQDKKELRTERRAEHSTSSHFSSCGRSDGKLPDEGCISNHSIETILKHLKLNTLKHTRASHLSAGQLRRLSFSRLLLSKTPLWILDEPTTALDQEGQGLFTELLENHLSHQGLAVIATHHALNIQAPLKTLTLKVNS